VYPEVYVMVLLTNTIASFLSSLCNLIHRYDYQFPVEDDDSDDSHDSDESDEWDPWDYDEVRFL
jgi:hypothetical protein